MVVELLQEIVGADHVLVDEDLRASYEQDWTGRYRGQARAVVRPASTEEVARVLRACRGADVPVVPQGGNTGLVGAGVPRGEGMVVLSTARLTSVGEVDPAAMQVTLGAGVTIAGWRDAARRAGFDSPIDFGARDSATVGGAIATNAGGSRVVRFGTTRRQLAGVRAVLMDGTVVGSLAGLPKESAGLHWPSLLAGAEGTLAVVTEARLRVVPWYRRRAAAMVAVGSTAAATDLLARLRSALPSLDTIEVIYDEAMQLVAGHLGRTPPLPRSDLSVFVECAAHTDPTDELVTALHELPAGLVVDSAMATDDPAIDALFEFRDRITEAIAAAGASYKLDVAVPVGRLPELVDAARAAASARGAQLCPFGHLAEGNLHLNFLGLDSTRTSEVATDVLGAVAHLGGTISAEHGIGIAKAAWLPLIRSSGERRAAAAIKQALDPAGLLNPGVLGVPISATPGDATHMGT